MRTEEIQKEIEKRFLDDTMFVRTIFCHPNIKMQIRNSVKSDDIKVYTSEWLGRNEYIMSKDILRKVNDLSMMYDSADFINNTVTVIVSIYFY